MRRSLIGMYVVFEDLARATGPKVHRAYCYYFRNWKQNPTTTTTWHETYDTEKEAWEVCSRIAKRTGKKPSKASCCFPWHGRWAWLKVRFPKQDKKTVPFPRRPTNSELYDDTRNCFWIKYTADLSEYGYRPRLTDFRKYFAEHTYPTWNNIIESYNRLMASIIRDIEPSTPEDLVYDYSKEKNEKHNLEL